MVDLYGLAGRRVLVTGASRGIGLAIVSALARAGCALAVCARDADRLDEVARDLGERYGVNVHAQGVDVTEPQVLERFVGQAADRLGGLDGLVVNAGGGRGGGLGSSTPQDWEATYRLNVGQAERAIRAAAPYLRITGHGSVVVIASISGWKPAPVAQYGAAKAAQIYLAASLARELGPEGIRVNAVSPGSTLVPGKRWDRMRTEDPRAFAAFAAEFPAGRLVEPEDVAEVVAFLLSGRARGVSGANIPVDRAQNAPSADGY